MKKMIKWGSILIGALFVLVIAAMVIVPRLIDVQKYKPIIEQRVAEATGRPFALKGDLSLSLLPWVGLALSDLHLGNPPGFKEKDLVAVKSFEVRVKLLPLIYKDIQVKRFILVGPRIELVRNKDGRANWEGIGKPSTGALSKPGREQKSLKEAPEVGLPIQSLTVGEFAIRDGSILWIDHAKSTRKTLSDVNFQIKDVSLDRPVHFSASARLDKKPLSIEGDVGPLGTMPGRGKIPVNLIAKVAEQLELGLKGSIIDPQARQQFNLEINVAPFSPRKLASAWGQKFPVSTADPEALKRIALKAKLAGNPQNISISDGLLEIDQSAINFSFRAREFFKPDVKFNLKLNEIDLDRYLPSQEKQKPGKEEKRAQAPERKKTDYKPLRQLVVEGEVRAGKIKVSGASIQDIYLKILGKNGRFQLDPLNLNLYQGSISSKGVFDVRRDTPQSKIELQIKNVQARPLLNDLMKKDFLEGTVKSKMAIDMAGDDAEGIKRTLNGQGDIIFNDGAIVGIDLAGMVRNVQAAFGLAEKSKEKPRTDFTELHIPFTLKNGAMNTPKTSLLSPLIRVTATGDANLVQETLNFKVEPKFVATLKGQGDTTAYSGLMVPVLVGGTFSAPKFRPDLAGMLKEKIPKEIPKSSELKKLIPGQSSQEKPSQKVEETLKNLFNSFPHR